MTSSAEIRRLVHEGEMRAVPAIKVGDQWRISRAALDEWSRTGGAAPAAVKKPGGGKR
jgi:excisionase family DNA binding protein